MSLYDEEQRKKEEAKTKKLKTLLIGLIIFSVVLIISLMILIYYLLSHPSKVSVYIDSELNQDLQKVINVETDESGKDIISAPIKLIAPALGYQANNGEYTIVSEDTNSCNVSNKNEVAIFKLNSDIIYKKDLTVNSEYEIVKIDKSVFEKDGELWVSEQGLEEAFNINIQYTRKTKKLSIYTLDYYVKKATDKYVKPSSGTSNSSTAKYKALANEFANKKSIFETMVVAISDNNLYGVINYETGEEVLGFKYDKITYIPHKSAFLVSKDDNVGIISSDSITRIPITFDELTLIDYEKELYLAKSNDLYGVVNIKGDTIIYPEYDKIGIDINGYERNGVKSGFVLIDALIPIQKDGKWGLYNIDSSKTMDIIYDKIGCNISNSSSTQFSLLVIPEENAVVVCRNGKYGFINKDGEEYPNCVFEKVYMEVLSGNTQYYMIWKEQNTGEEKTYKVLDYLGKKHNTNNQNNQLVNENNESNQENEVQQVVTNNDEQEVQQQEQQNNEQEVQQQEQQNDGQDAQQQIQ